MLTCLIGNSRFYFTPNVSRSGPPVCPKLRYRNGFSPAETRISECRDFRSSKQELILVQIWVVLILSHIVYALRERIATTANCDPFEVSIPVLVDLLPRLSSPSALQLDQLVQSGRQLGLLRASPRLVLNVPQVELSCYQPAPPDLPRQRQPRTSTARRRRAPKPSTRVCGYQLRRQRRQASKEAKAIRAAQAKAAQPPTRVT